MGVIHLLHDHNFVNPNEFYELRSEFEFQPHRESEPYPKEDSGYVTTSLSDHFSFFVMILILYITFK